MVHKDWVPQIRNKNKHEKLTINFSGETNSIKLRQKPGLVYSELDSQSKGRGFKFRLILHQMEMVPKPCQVNLCTQSWFIYEKKEKYRWQNGTHQINIFRKKDTIETLLSVYPYTYPCLFYFLGMFYGSLVTLTWKKKTTR